MLGQVNSGLFQSHDKSLEYMLVYFKLITNLFRVTIEEFTDPVSSSECQSMVWHFVIKWKPYESAAPAVQVTSVAH